MNFLDFHKSAVACMQENKSQITVTYIVLTRIELAQSKLLATPGSKSPGLQTTQRKSFPSRNKIRSEWLSGYKQEYKLLCGIYKLFERNYKFYIS